MDQRHTILKRCNSDPHAAKSQCIRFQPDILLCDRHIDLCHILNRQSLFPIYRNDHNRCTCCTSGIGSGFGKLQDLLLICHNIKFPRLLITCAWRLHTCFQDLKDLFLLYGFIFIFTDTYSVKNILHAIFSSSYSYHLLQFILIIQLLTPFYIRHHTLHFIRPSIQKQTIDHSHRYIQIIPHHPNIKTP